MLARREGYLTLLHCNGEKKPRAGRFSQEMRRNYLGKKRLDGKLYHTEDALQSIVINQSETIMDYLFCTGAQF